MYICSDLVRFVLPFPCFATTQNIDLRTISQTRIYEQDSRYPVDEAA